MIQINAIYLRWVCKNTRLLIYIQSFFLFLSFPIIYHNTSVKVVVSGELDYSNKEVQDDMANLLAAMENTTYIDGPYTESWLSALLDYVDRWGDLYENLDISDEQKLINVLQTVILYYKDIQMTLNWILLYANIIIFIIIYFLLFWR